MTKYTGMTRHLMAGTAAVAMLAGAPAVVTGSAVVAQDYTTGDMTGTVRDEAGNAVSGATVTVTSNRGETRSVTTGANGGFTIPRLPIGDYVASISADGYNALDSQAVSVNLGTGAQVTFTLDSMDSSVEEIFVVGTATSDWDFNTTTSGISVDVDELFDTTPISRDATSVALLAPGTSRGDTAFGNLASLSGSSVAENVYYVNGLNVTNFRNFLGGSTIPFEFYDQIEVKTGGYPAEFGRSTGGVLNAVTKSGDNEFHFGANIYWQPNFLRSAGHVSRTSGYSEHFVSDRHEWNIWASGPIVKDKLFFYALFNPRNTKSTSWGFTSQNRFADTAPFWAAKFDFIPWDGHHFEATFFNDTRTSTSDIYDYLDGAETTNYSRDVNGGEQSARLDELPVDDITLSNDPRQVRFFSGGKNQIFKYTGSFTDWMSISAMYGISQFDQTTQSDGDLCPYVWDTRDTGWGGRSALGCWESSVAEAGDDRREAFRVDADFYFDLAGEHHVRVGVDREELTADTFTRYSGNIYYRYLNSGSAGSPFSAEEDYLVRIRQYSAGGQFEIIQTAQYIQDSWQVTDDLLLSLGLRNETFDNRNALGETFIKTSNQLAPRLGFSWDVAGDGSQRLFGSFGRYYLPIAANTNIRLAGSEIFTEGFYPYNYEGPNEGIDPETGAPLGVGDPLAFTVISDGEVLDVAELVDSDFDPQYQDEWMLGYERALDNGWAFGIRGIHRSLKSAIEDVGINHAIAQYAKDNNTGIYWNGNANLDANTYDWILTDPGFSGIIYVLTNPGTDMTVSTTALGDGSLQEITLSAEDLGYEKARRTYKALEFTFDREFDGKWGMSGSYTMSWTKGNYEGSVKSDIGQDDAGLTQDFDLPSVMEGAYGYLPTDRRHRFKLWGSYQATDQILVGVNTSITSPRKFGCIGNLPVNATIPGAQLNDPTDTYSWNDRYQGDYWFCGGQPTPRGSQNKSDWLYQFDLSVNIRPSFAEEIPGDFSIRVDVFNLFNFHGVTDVSERGEIGQTTGRSLAGTTPDNSFFYGAASGYQTPRRVRLGAKYTF